MSQSLPAGTRVRTLCGELQVIDKIGGGSQGEVYRVDYNGERKALKWYYNDVFLNRDDFIRNLQRNIDAHAPTQEFLWPIDRTDLMRDGRFGYVMDLCPQGYLSADELFVHPGHFPSYRRIVDACINIAHAFGILHDRGYVYRDISGGNFFVNPLTGKVLICDNDNVAPPNRDTGIRGTPRFMAPEVVVTQDNPTEASDRHSLAVIIFYMLVMQHPLEGRRMGMLDADAQMRLYGTDPLFVFDRADDSNRPVVVGDTPNNALRIWPQLPRHMRTIFERAFSREALTTGRGRPDEAEWISELVRLRSEIVRCPYCGRDELMLEDARPKRCENNACRALVRPGLRAEFPMWGYALPVVDDTRIYACQAHLVTDAAIAIDPLVWVCAPNNGKGSLGLKNVSSKPWQVEMGGRRYSIAPGNVSIAMEGSRLLLGDLVGNDAIRIVRNVG